MIIKSIRVINFRSIKDETLFCDNLTALVGANGSGKSSFLHAMELFQNKSPRIDEEDYYNRNTIEDIVVAVTFKDFSDSAKKLFVNYIQNDELTVERVFKWNDGRPSQTLHGSTLQNPDFVEVYNESSATNAKEKYERLREKTEYRKFPAWSSRDKTYEFLRKWESDNPGKCRRLRDDGQFFGFNEVAQGFLGRFARFLYIPAVRDAAEVALEGRGSVLTELMDLVIRSSLAERSEIKELQEETRKRYAEVMDPSKLAELKTLESEMTKTLQNFVPDARIGLFWQPLKELEIRLPDAIASLVEDGYQSTVARTGHGLQRAFIMTMLQHLSVARASIVKTNPEKSSTNESPVLVLIIEEPELYQHPSRQRHLAEVLLALAEGTIAGVSGKMQIVYSTHSPHFVGINRINQIRLLRKIPSKDGKPKITKIFSTNLQEVADELSRIFGRSSEYTSDTLRPRLQAIMTPWMNEGFFADVVVLVEGEGDRAAIIGTAKSMGYKLESLGISIIPCSGKRNLDRPTTIFRKLGIPVYVIWDGDKGERDAITKENRDLLSLMEQKEEDWPSQIADTFACFEKNMQDVLKKEVGEEMFEKCMQECENDFAMKRKSAIKNPIVISTIIEKAKKNKRQCKTLESIVQKIIRLKK